MLHDQVMQNLFFVTIDVIPVTPQPVCRAEHSTRLISRRLFRLPQALRIVGEGYLNCGR